MEAPFPVHISRDAVTRLTAFCRECGLRYLALVADANTYAALGRRVEHALRAAGLDVLRILLEGDEVIADGAHILQVLVPYDDVPRTYLAVGSGTITDIVRFATHRMGRGFISLPTAPSVDGYASVNAPLVIGRFKCTVNAQGPLAIFVDLPTLCAAPKNMIAAGFGDVLGKFTSLADWKLGRLIWDEPYDDSVAEQTRNALCRCVDHAADIGAADPIGVRTLMEALIASGVAMLRFGDSRPASGAEHHLSHYWEMRLLLEGRPAILHGAKVGVATLRIAGWYDRIRDLSPDAAARRLRSTTLPRYEDLTARLRQVYGPAAEQVIDYHQEFLRIDPARHKALIARVLASWATIQDIARQVPPPEELAGLLRVAGGPNTPEALGLSADDADTAESYAHYLRPRFTVLKLARLLGLLRE